MWVARTVWLGLFAGALALAPGACVTSTYSCADDSQCGADGFCEASGFCSFADGECDSGRRYGTYAGSGLGGTCVVLPGGSTGVGSTSTTPDLASSSSDESGAGVTTASTGRIVPDSTTGSSSETSAGPGTSTGEGTGTGVVLSRVEEGLLVDYRFDEGSGSIVHDSSPVDPPIDLTLEGDGFTWLSDGLRFLGEPLTMAVSTTSITKVNMACQASNELTMEAWVTPIDVLIPGPPRLVSYSLDSSERNASLMLGADLDELEGPAVRGRVRTLAKFLNGTPSIAAPVTVDIEGVLTHIVLVHDVSGTERIYIDGTMAAQDTREGDFAIWDTTGAMRLVLGNEISGNRALDGTLHLAAIYCRALDEDEVTQNFEVGY